ncbi:MAG: 4'-phosphopantetheinyl transferase superfamily protein [Actinomycetota bacterium]
MIRGVGVDAVPVARMRRALERTPRIAERVFTAHELETSERRASRAASLAARFAAKEACRKALATVVPWRDVEVRSEDRVPSLRVHGHDDVFFHVSLTHTDDVAVAVVLAEER